MSTKTQQGQNTENDEQMHTSSDSDSIPELDKSEQQEVQERVNISALVVHETIREEGERELRRTFLALVCSAIAAGLSMGFSLIGMGVLHAYLPATNWRPLVDSFGYSMGFLIVVLGRQQLFTENTVTVILPLLARFNKSTFLSVLRLWSIVFIGNLVGTALFATLIAQTSVLPPHIQDSFITLSQEALAGGFGLLLLKGVFAGWLIALMVWLLPAAEATRLHTIIFITYIIEIASFSHIIVNSVGAFYLVNRGKMGLLTALGSHLLPVLLGNILGGVILVAVLNYGQVAGEKNQERSIGSATLLVPYLFHAFCEVPSSVLA